MNAAEKTKIRSIVLDMVDGLLEQDAWPTGEEQRRFEIAWYGHRVGDILMQPSWGYAEILEGEVSFWERKGVESVAIVSFFHTEGGRPTAFLYFYGEGPLAAEGLLVDEMIWTRLPRWTPGE